jgi:uncharacterized phage-associated protein
MKLNTKKQEILASDVAKYFLYRAITDGDLVSNLKMQKLVYYAYAWTLAKTNKKLFQESIQAWPNGPVVKSLYDELKAYGASPISEDYLNISSDIELENLKAKFQPEVLKVLDEVYEAYIGKSAFELVVMTHGELPWREARKGLAATEKCYKDISDQHIKEEFKK